MTTIGEYIQYRKDSNPKLTTSNIDNEMRARVMRKTGQRSQLSIEKSVNRKAKARALKKRTQ